MNRKTFIKTTALGMGALFFLGTQNIFANPKSYIETTEEQHPIIIIGSGYGGAVAALRLCEAGKKVCMLEMGLNWEKSEIPFSKMQNPGKSAAWLRDQSIAPFFNLFSLKPFTGALDRLDFKDIKVWVGRGVGGGSLVNGGMTVLPKKEYFEEIFPNLDSRLFYEKYFPKTQQELKSNVIDEEFLKDCKYYQFNNVGEKEAHKAGFKTVRVPNVYDFKYLEKEYRNEVPKSALDGEVIYGNNHGKNSLDKTYLKKALATGNLKILNLHTVQNIKNENEVYRLDVHQINTSGEVIAKKSMICQQLILAAGTMGTLELLLKSQAENGLQLNDQVGKNWGNNGNFMTGRNWVKAFSGGLESKQSTIPVGGVDNWDDPHHSFFAELAPLPMNMNVATALYLLINKVDQPGSVSFDHTTKKLVLDWSRKNTTKMQANAKYFVRKMNQANGGTRSHLLFHNGWGYDICYHPLGGVVLGKATSEFGQLRNHKNLYVLDGSLIPASIGVNPFLTITALVEYCMENLISQKVFG
ncbi:GMC family oxidoreductase N-terminal domain-containing protein [Elizabethkingia sp. JS20170427COW]|uniref:GMC family oxidoreductase N-terminal domain-containing protein n=1 Tax=Elizabethkingia sp. JS20170427COW TaxID=2583851 RepID=UPI001110AC6F|nr:GMC family oxidoreductase N-terminal domain-containing protein [Elizabethkingia sp. JS20170427COW]QCX53750.1 GMC family oxidoreductase [Elizabethkingia sp. JS20170427COW]